MSVDGYFTFYCGCHIAVNDDAKLSLKTGFINNGCNLVCVDSISIGNQTKISTGVTIRDSDAHLIIHKGYIQKSPILIGDHVWIGLNTTILKGVCIGDNSVVAAMSLVNKNVQSSSLYGGVPAKMIRDNIIWE